MNKHDQPMTKEEAVEFFAGMFRGPNHEVLVDDGTITVLSRHGLPVAFGYPVVCLGKPCRDKTCRGWKLQLQSTRPETRPERTEKQLYEELKKEAANWERGPK